MSRAIWFVDNGVGVFPLLSGARAKEPACKSWDDFQCTREDAARFKNYGVRLASWLGVIDTDSPESEAWVALQIASGQLPESPFHVKGARGLHRYYRINRGEAPPKFIKRDSLTIEFRNAGQYVVGPGSTHPTGVIYTPSEWSWNMNDLPLIPDAFDFGANTARAVEGTGLAYQFPDVVAAGERHDALYKLLRSFKALGNDKDSTWELIKLAAANRCDPPLKPNSELRRWFDRGYDASDRPIERVLPKKFTDLGGSDEV